jgi:phytoene/squalene synthetase
MRRRASTHMRDRVEAVAAALREADQIGDPAKLRVRETRRELERRWLATSESLSSQGQTALADQARQFVRDIPPARTEREWLIAGLLEQGRSRQ